MTGNQSVVRKFASLSCLLLLAFFTTGCLKGATVRTKPYSWRSKVYKKEKLQKDWFLPPAGKKKQTQHKKRWNLCAKDSMRPYMQQLKNVTHQCVELTHNYHELAGGFRLGYTTLLAVALIGGTAVVTAPVFTVVKVPNASIDPAVALTVAGASVSAFALLWIQVGQLGKTSNDTFEKYTSLAKLVQESEIRWQTQVCHASSEKLARVQASTILKGLASQCVKTVPKVKVNPDVFKQVSQQQSNINAVLTKYQLLQQHMELASARKQSQQTLQTLVNQLEARQAKRFGLSGMALYRLEQEMKGLCQQASMEYKRLQSLQTKANRSAEPGSWQGLCETLKRSRKKLFQQKLFRLYQQSEQKQQALVKSLGLQHQRLVRVDRKKASKKYLRLYKRLHLTCLQAKAEHKRQQALLGQLRKQGSGTLPPGAWEGTCSLYKESLPPKK